MLKEEPRRRREPLAVATDSSTPEVGGERGGEEKLVAVAEEEQKAVKDSQAHTPALGNGRPKFILFQNSGSDEHRLRGCDLGVKL